MCDSRNGIMLALPFIIESEYKVVRRANTVRYDSRKSEDKK